MRFSVLRFLSFVFEGNVLGSYRSRFDIIADMLRVVKGNDGAKKTQIMYQANLSYRLLTKYLKRVMKAGLIRFEKKENRYVLTCKGEEFLERYKDFSRRNKHVEKQFNELRNRKRALIELLSF